MPHVDINADVVKSPRSPSYDVVTVVAGHFETNAEYVAAGVASRAIMCFTAKISNRRFSSKWREQSTRSCGSAPALLDYYKAGRENFAPILSTSVSGFSTPIRIGKMLPTRQHNATKNGTTGHARPLRLFRVEVLPDANGLANLRVVRRVDHHHDRGLFLTVVNDLVSFWNPDAVTRFHDIGAAIAMHG